MSEHHGTSHKDGNGGKETALLPLNYQVDLIENNIWIRCPNKAKEGK